MAIAGQLCHMNRRCSVMRGQGKLARSGILAPTPMTDAAEPLDADELMNLADRIAGLPPDDAAWVERLWQECVRLRMQVAEQLTQTPLAIDPHDEVEPQLAQIALDTAEWLKTLWSVGYMGAGNFPAAPRSAFPAVELEDVLKSALFARIRRGQRPLPFPPPTRQGSPWHELLEGPAETHAVDAEIVVDEQGRALAARIEGCADWQIVEEVVPAREYVLQHQGKGPLFRLHLADFCAELCREEARWTRRIVRQERGGLPSYTLEWLQDDGGRLPVPLRAATWERAESEALHWIALKHPRMYGQVRFERVG